MKLFTTSVIPQIDCYTMAHEPVSDLDLMERAARSAFNYIENSELRGKIAVVCGSGNNGGDGLALARMLAQLTPRFQTEVYLFDMGRELSPSTFENLERLKPIGEIQLISYSERDPLPHFNNHTIVIDAMFGSGLNRPLSGYAAEIIKQINRSGAYIISIDLPSGLMGEDNRQNIPENIVQATCTLTFQFPKISFLLPENKPFVGKWIVLDIALHPNAIKDTLSVFHFIDEQECKMRLKRRTKFSHKGNYGHALLISGSYGKMGAAVLSSKACLRTGAGLLTVHVPHGTYPIIQTAVPEAMCSIDDSDLMFTGINDLEMYAAVGIGPAIGQKVNTQRGFRKLLDEVKVPLVIDADAINMLGLHSEWMTNLPENIIITPHPKEFERIAGKSTCRYEQMQKAMVMAHKNKMVVILKGAHTIVACPNGDVWFNSTGNPGMATAGSGDALTGIILGLLSQGYSTTDSAIIGVYLHGLAGDIASMLLGEYSLMASDIIDNLGLAFKKTAQ